MRDVYIPLCCKLAAGLGSEGWREASGQEEVVEALVLQRTMFPEMKAVQQGEEEEEEEGRALFGNKKTNFTINQDMINIKLNNIYTNIHIHTYAYTC